MKIIQVQKIHFNKFTSQNISDNNIPLIMNMLIIIMITYVNHLLIKKDQPNCYDSTTCKSICYSTNLVNIFDCDLVYCNDYDYLCESLEKFGKYYIIKFR